MLHIPLLPYYLPYQTILFLVSRLPQRLASPITPSIHVPVS